MIINFVGNYQNGYVGEKSDEYHIARELEALGHIVRRIPRDEWREHVIDGKDYPNLPQDLKADINIIAKWHHFYDGSFIAALRAQSGAPVFYWVWDFMYDSGFPSWHLEMALAADLYLSGEAGIFSEYSKRGIKPYYFQMDVCDGTLVTYSISNKLHDVVFTGSCLGQGHRKEWLQIINKEVPVKIWSWNYENWRELGFDAYPAVYSEEYNRLIAESKIILGFSVESDCWGYWSNRVGKVLRAGGFLLQEYAPGMETQLDGYNVDFFSTPDEAIRKIKHFLKFPRIVAYKNTERWTSADLAVKLSKLIERYLKGDSQNWNRLP